MNYVKSLTICFLAALVLSSCKMKEKTALKTKNDVEQKSSIDSSSKFLNQPLVTEIYTADPSAHIFNNKIYIYPSHDIDNSFRNESNGNKYDMIDYHVLSMDSIGGKVTIHDVALTIDDIPWAESKLWAPDVAYKNNTYYLYFPVKDKKGIFRIGVATSKKPEGPFKPEPAPIKESYSIDPAVFTDDDGTSYMYFGGISGGQLYCWDENVYDSTRGLKDTSHLNPPATAPRIAKMSKNMLEFDEEVKPIQILDKQGNPILTKDFEKRFFEAAWIHKKDGTYYFSYSTGDTHLLVYATGNNPYGPFTYQGVLNNPVQGWTNHHSIIEIEDKWYLFYHDTQLSNVDHLRNVKVTELKHNSDGSIETINSIIN